MGCVNFTSLGFTVGTYAGAITPSVYRPGASVITSPAFFMFHIVCATVAYFRFSSLAIMAGVERSFANIARIFVRILTLFLVPFGLPVGFISAFLSIVRRLALYPR